jgi:hypothetical protein
MKHILDKKSYWTEKKCVKSLLGGLGSAYVQCSLYGMDSIEHTLPGIGERERMYGYNPGPCEEIPLPGQQRTDRNHTSILFLYSNMKHPGPLVHSNVEIRYASILCAFSYSLFPLSPSQPPMSHHKLSASHLMSTVRIYNTNNERVI